MQTIFKCILGKSLIKLIMKEEIDKQLSYWKQTERLKTCLVSYICFKPTIGPNTCHNFYYAKTKDHNLNEEKGLMHTYFWIEGSLEL